MIIDEKVFVPPIVEMELRTCIYVSFSFSFLLINQLSSGMKGSSQVSVVHLRELM